jgi:hypothetical protein
MSVIPIERNPVTLDDIARMLKLFAGLDGHPREADDIDLWVIASTAGRWTRAQVAAATLTIVSAWTGFRIQPGHVTAQVAADRERIRKLWYCPPPPYALERDTIAETAWRRRAAEEFADRALFALATGRPLEEVPLTLEVEAVRPAAISPAEHDRRMAIATGKVGKGIVDVPVQAPDPVKVDRDVRAAARARKYAEIDACSLCDPGGMQLRNGLPTDVVCRHPAPASSSKSGLDEERHASVDHRVAV